MSEAHVVHGGPDGGLPIAWDFSTNANPLPQPAVLTEAIRAADRRRYPDPHYTALRTHLAAQWGCDPQAIHPTAGSAEGIRRLTLAARLHGVQTVWVPEPGYGDYRAAAQALGLSVQAWQDEASLRILLQQHDRAPTPVLCWLCEPNNPTGRHLSPACWQMLGEALDAAGQLVVALDLAYAPLVLQPTGDGVGAPLPLLDRCWRLWSPNKALGLTGVRAGAMQAPLSPPDRAARDAAGWEGAVAALAPSWVLSAEGVALLMAWHTAPVQDWLSAARHTLAAWAVAQRAMLASLDWHGEPSATPFFLAAPPWVPRVGEAAPHAVARSRALDQTLRLHGIRLRDAGSLGRPGWFRLSVQAPEAQRALHAALSTTHTQEGRA